MKKFFLMAAVALMCLACKSSNDAKTVVVYFSATGNTRAAAEQLAEVMKADLCEIVPAQLYTAEDLDYRNAESRSSLEMKDPEARPELAACPDVAAYDTIFVGFPVWWNVCPRVINTWIENTDLTGKAVVVFATSGSSSIDGSMEYLLGKYTDINWVDGRLLNGADQAMLEAWKAEL